MTGITLAQSRCITAPSDVTTEGDTAANVFERFDRGASPGDVVTELVLPVETVECLLANLGAAPRRRADVARGLARAARSIVVQSAARRRRRSG